MITPTKRLKRKRLHVPNWLAKDLGSYRDLNDLKIEPQEVIPKWEKLTSSTYRMWVPTGWIVQTYRISHGVQTGAYLGESLAMVFVPDPEHSWKVKNG